MRSCVNNIKDSFLSCKSYSKSRYFKVILFYKLVLYSGKPYQNFASTISEVFELRCHMLWPKECNIFARSTWLFIFDESLPCIRTLNQIFVHRVPIGRTTLY